MNPRPAILPHITPIRNVKGKTPHFNPLRRRLLRKGNNNNTVWPLDRFNAVLETILI